MDFPDAMPPSTPMTAVGCRAEASGWGAELMGGGGGLPLASGLAAGA